MTRGRAGSATVCTWSHLALRCVGPMQKADFSGCFPKYKVGGQSSFAWLQTVYTYTFTPEVNCKNTLSIPLGTPAYNTCRATTKETRASQGCSVSDFVICGRTQRYNSKRSETAGWPWACCLLQRWSYSGTPVAPRTGESSHCWAHPDPLIRRGNEAGNLHF